MRKNDIIKLGKLRLHFIRSSTIWVHKRLLLWELIVDAMLKVEIINVYIYDYFNTIKKFLIG